MLRKTIATLLLSISFSLATNASVTTGVGKIRLDGVATGLVYFTKSDGTNFPCSTDSDRMYVSPNFTAEQRKAYLSLFLTARSIGAKVKVWYSYDSNVSNGVCLMTDAELQD